MRKLTVLACTALMILTSASSSVSADVNRVSAIGAKASLSEGYYVLSPKCSPTKALTIKSSSTSAGATTVSSTYNKKYAQQFIIKEGTKGSYILKNRRSKLILSVKNSSTKSGAIVRQNTWQKVNAQRWYFIKFGDYYRIQSSISKNFLTVNNNSKTSGAAVIMKGYSSTSTGQLWKVQKIGSSGTSSSDSGSSSSNKYKTSSKTGMSSEDYKVYINIVGAVETGGQVYGVRDYGDYTPPYANTSNEHTCTLGWGGFYGDEAQYLVSQIQKRSPSTFKKIDSKGLIAAALKKNWVSSRWKPNSAEQEVLKKLIVTDIGKKIQDEMFIELTKTFVSTCQSTYTNNTWAIMMYCQIRHLGGSSGAKRIFDRCKAKNSYTLDSIMDALQQDQADTSSKYQVGDSIFWSRHLKCVEFIQKYA